MRNGFLGSLVTLTAGAGLALAQPPAGPGRGVYATLYPDLVAVAASTQDQPATPGAPPRKLPEPGPAAGTKAPNALKPVPAPAATPAASPSCGGECGSAPGGADGPAACCAAPARRPNSWGDVEFLLWFVKGGPVPPLVTTGPPQFFGLPGTPGTTILGPQNFQYGTIPGIRSSGGLWLNDAQTFGAESSGLSLARRADGFRVSSDAAGAPLLGRPSFDTSIGIPNAFLIALPDFVAGGLAASSSSQLYSADGNLLVRLTGGESACSCNPCDRGRLNLFGLAGFRYLNLEEDLEVASVSRVLPGGVAGFFGAPVLAPAGVLTYDKFQTHNHFYGGQVGTRAEWSGERLSLKATATVALGVVQEISEAFGNTARVGGGLPAAVGPGGFLAVGSNSVRQLRDEFAVVPEVGVKVGYRLTDRLNVQAGYSFLYVSNVLRPGDQVDTVINPTLVPSTAVFGLPFGPARPAPTGNQSDFFAHGVSLGVEYTY